MYCFITINDYYTKLVSLLFSYLFITIHNTSMKCADSLAVSTYISKLKVNHSKHFLKRNISILASYIKLGEDMSGDGLSPQPL